MTTVSPLGLPGATFAEREKRRWLKTVAAEHATRWRSRGPLAVGRTVLRERGATLRFESGICVEARAACGARRANLEGLRLVGWLVQDVALSERYVPGARAILYQQRGDEMTLALLGRSDSFLEDDVEIPVDWALGA